jgi:beta-glucosidase
VDVLQGIGRAAGPETTILHARGVDAASPDTAGIGEAAAIAARADVAILVIGESQEMSAEASSRATIGLPGRQADLAHAVQATGTPVVVVLMNGRPLAIPSLVENVPAVVESWYLGVEMGNAVADVLFGDYNPGGKLPVTFPRTTGQVPIYYGHRNTGRPPSPTEKYTSKYLDVPWTPLFPFGHGLSYTRFSYGPPRLGAATLQPGESMAVQVEVTNSGTRGGHEVVQLYLRDEVASVTRPVKELRGFERIRLEPGESRTVTFEVEVDDLAFWNQEMRRVVEPGFFTVYVGSSSEAVQEARFELVTRDGPVDVPVSCAAAG